MKTITSIFVALMIAGTALATDGGIKQTATAQSGMVPAPRSAGVIMKCDDVAQEVLNGTVTAVVWVIIIWIANRFRNWRAERKLRLALSQMGVSQEQNTFGVVIKNNSEYEITVRDVTLLTNNPEEAFTLLFAEKGYDYIFQEKHSKAPRKLTQYLRCAQRQPQPLIEKSGELGPYTSGTWKVNVAVFLDHPEFIPNKCHLAIQYKTLLGNPKVLVIHSNERCSKFIEESIHRQIEQLKQRLTAEQPG